MSMAGLIPVNWYRLLCHATVSRNVNGWVDSSELVLSSVSGDILT